MFPNFMDTALYVNINNDLWETYTQEENRVKYF